MIVTPLVRLSAIVTLDCRQVRCGGLALRSAIPKAVARPFNLSPVSRWLRKAFRSLHLLQIS